MAKNIHPRNMRPKARRALNFFHGSCSTKIFSFKVHCTAHQYQPFVLAFPPFPDKLPNKQSLWRRPDTSFSFQGQPKKCVVWQNILLQILGLGIIISANWTPVLKYSHLFLLWPKVVCGGEEYEWQECEKEVVEGVPALIVLEVRLPHLVTQCSFSLTH